MRAAALLEQELVFLVPAQLRSVLQRNAPDGWHKGNEGPRELCVSAPVVSAYFSHHFLRNSGSGWRPRDILWTVAVSEMVVFSIMGGSVRRLLRGADILTGAGSSFVPRAG